MARPRVAIHKFASCDGCQLAFLNAGEDLLTLAQLVDIVHFAEAGPLDPDAQVDIAFIEGSITTAHDAGRIRQIRDNSRYVVTLGACATAGGVQALRNLADAPSWLGAVYATPQYLDALATSTPIAAHIKVDFELWGCPVTSRQVMLVVRALLNGVMPYESRDKVCLECKRQQQVCVMVTRGEPCMGPVTRSGCGALCPSYGRACYACYGPSDTPNTEAMGLRLAGLGLVPDEIARRFLFINNAAAEYHAAGLKWRQQHND